LRWTPQRGRVWRSREYWHAIGGDHQAAAELLYNEGNRPYSSRDELRDAIDARLAMLLLRE
jgi:hypothetical protein